MQDWADGQTMTVSLANGLLSHSEEQGMEREENDVAVLDNETPVKENSLRSISTQHNLTEDQLLNSFQFKQIDLKNKTLSDSELPDSLLEENVNSSSSQEDILATIPDVPVKEFLIHVGHSLERSNEHIAPLIKKIICDHWIEDLPYLFCMTPPDWAAMGLPHQFIRCIQQELEHLKNSSASCDKSQLSDLPSASQNETSSTLKQIDSTDSTRDSSVEESSTNCLKKKEETTTVTLSQPQTFNSLRHWLSHICSLRGFSDSRIQAILHCLCDELWFDSIEQLVSLTRHQLLCLDIDSELYEFLQIYLPCKAEGSRTKQIICEAAFCLGRPVEEISTILPKAQDMSPEELVHISVDAWLKRKLPLKLLEEIRQMLSSPLSNCASIYNIEGYFLQPHSHDLTRKYSTQLRNNVVEKNFSMQSRCVTSREEFKQKQVTVEKILEEAGKRLGKSPDDMKPIIHKVVKENWIDSLQTLSFMSYAEWLDLGIPKRLADVLIVVLSDPIALQLNLVQYSPYERNPRDVDLHTLAWRMQDEIRPMVLYVISRCIIRLIEAIICDPFNEMHRVIRKSNSFFKKCMIKYKSAILFIQSIGFQELNSIYALFVACVPRLTEAHAVMAQVASVACQRHAK